MKRRLFLITVLTVAVIAMSTAFAFAATPKISASVKTKLDSRKVTVKVSTKKSTLKKGTVYRMYFRMYNGKNVAQQKLVKVNLKTKNKKAFSVTLPYYGQYKVQGYLYKGKKKVATYKAFKVNVKASEYNIVALRASTPVLITTLKFLGNLREDGKPTYTTTEDGKVIPTVVMLGRATQYNWDKLPKDWFRTPLEYKAKSANDRVDALAKYVKNLYASNKKAKFHIYINDWHLRELPMISYGAGIPDEQMTMTFVTDGSASYQYFRNAYAEEDDAQVKHDLMKQDYQKFRNAMVRGGKYTLKYETDQSHILKCYVYAMLEVENMNGVKTDWWVVRKSNDTFELKDKTFQAKVVGDSRVTSNYINNLLATLQKSPDKEKQFKELYKFDDSQIKNAIAKGKKPMMILGSSKAVETADPIAPFIRFTEKYYGDGYAYLYKGHPGYITEADPERMAMMKSLGCEVLDSSIAAELFQYYNPTLFMSGYQSSTFQNVGDASNDCGLYNIRKQAALDNPALIYAKDMDYFLTSFAKLADNDRDNAIKALANDPAHANYVVEFSDSLIEQTGDSIAVWDDTAGTVDYYSEKDGVFTKTKSE